MTVIIYKIYTRLIALVIKCIIGILTFILPNKVKAYAFDNFLPLKKIKTNKGIITFLCTGELPFFRADTFFSKEPETIEWIEKFRSDKVFWDIGANVGIYSIYAGLNLNLDILAFEPASNNFNLLNQNIKINKMDNNVSALSVAFSDKTQMSTFYMSDLETGSAHHSFGEPVNQFGEKLAYQYKQSMIAYSIDDFLATFDVPFPNYIKIDVDGIEHQIILGAQKTLSDERLSSILIELDTGREDYPQTIEIIESSGFKMISKHQILENVEKGSELANYIFSK